MSNIRLAFLTTAIIFGPILLSQIKTPDRSQYTIPTRGRYGEAHIFDKGAQFNNVMSYGADDTGSTNAAPAFRTAVATLGNAGGLVLAPPGDFLINTVDPASPSGLNCGIVIGNGTTTSYSTINNVTIMGSGYGTDAGVSASTDAQRGTTRLIAGGSVTQIICTKGPTLGNNIRNIHFDGNNTAANGIYFLHNGSGGAQDVSFRRFTAFSIQLANNASGSPNFISCGNIFTNINFGEMKPQGGGISLTSNGGIGTACSNLVQNINGLMGGGGRSAAVHFKMSDNNVVQIANVANYATCCFVSAAANASGVIRLTIGILTGTSPFKTMDPTFNVATWFANGDVLEVHGSGYGCNGMVADSASWTVTNVGAGGNTVDLIGSSSTGCSYTPTIGTGSGAFVFGGTPIRFETGSASFPYGNVMWHIGSNYTNTVNGAASATLANYLFDSSAERAGYPFVPKLTNIFGSEDSGALIVPATGQGLKSLRAFGWSGSTALEIYSFSRGDSGSGNGNGIDINSFGQVRLQGESMMPSLPLLFGSLPASPNGHQIYCSTCTHGSNPCTGGGTGAFAKRLNGAWVCN